MGQSSHKRAIRMLLLLTGLVCILQANANPAAVLPGWDVEETNEAGLIKPIDLDPQIYIEARLGGSADDDINEDTESDRATANSCGCGYSITNPASGRIVNGKEVNPVHNRPYQVRVQACWSNGCGLCGGTLLNKRFVMSAMHCIYNKNNGWARNIKAVIGEHNVQHDWETKAKEQAIQVVDMVPRNDYNPTTISNDVVILKLGEDVQFSKYVVPACLPSSSSNDYTGQSAVVSGWGAISWKGPTSPFLKETTVKITSASDRKCRPMMRPSEDSTKLCAYAEGTNSCQGDSGGPLVVKENGKNTVVGVVSYGPGGCVVPNVGVIYAKVTGFLDWIQQSIKDGWCDGNTGNTSPPATTSKPNNGKGKGKGNGKGKGKGKGKGNRQGKKCDLSCFIGRPSGNYVINGIQSKCRRGVCRATDGSDMCATLGVSGMC